MTEADLEAFKGTFGKNYDLASRRLGEGVAQIDKAIAVLQKARHALTGSDRNLRLAPWSRRDAR